MYQVYNDEYLMHHGVKGMHWGIRRYQNADGSLTPAGQKRYLQGDPRHLKKALKKEVRKQRSRQFGASNRWISGKPIGPNSEKLQKENANKRKAYENSQEYKKWLQEYKSFEEEQEKLYDSGNFDQDRYDKRQRELMNSRPKKNFNDTVWAYVVGKGFVDDYIHKGGKDLTIAYIKDLGFNETAAKQLTDKLLEKNDTLGGL